MLAALSAGLSIVGGIFNIGSGIKNARLQREQMRKQQAYNDKVALDVRRKGEVQKRQLRVAGATEIGELESAAASSGVAMTGTALDIKNLSQENINKDLVTLEDDIKAMVETARFSGEVQMARMQTELSNTRAKTFGNSLGMAQTGINIASDVKDYGGNFLDWLKGA